MMCGGKRRGVSAWASARYTPSLRWYLLKTSSKILRNSRWYILRVISKHFLSNSGLDEFLDTSCTAVCRSHLLGGTVQVLLVVVVLRLRERLRRNSSRRIQLLFESRILVHERLDLAFHGLQLV